jgi:hypothetical protein
VRRGLVAHVLGWIVPLVNPSRGVLIRVFMCEVAQVWGWFPLWFASVVRAEQIPLAPDVKKNCFHLPVFI